jgi:hypothetical protein
MSLRIGSFIRFASRVCGAVLAALLVVTPASAQNEGISALAGQVVDMQIGIADSIRGGVLGLGQTAAPFPGVFATTRIRTTDHDGYSYQYNGTSGSTYKVEADEVSIMAGAYVQIPGTVFRLGAFAGYGDLDLKLRANQNQIAQGQTGGHANAESTFYGGYAHAQFQSFYLLGTAVGMVGNSHVNESQLTTPVSYDTTGSMFSLDAGYTMPVPGLGSSNRPTFLDLRGGVLHSRSASEDFAVTFFGANDVLKTEASSTSLSLTAELFSVVKMTGGQTFKPYIKGTWRHFVDYDNTLEFVGSGAGTVFHSESANRGLVEIGGNYQLIPDKFAVTGAAYYEGASDQDTFGGRFGLSLKFN